MSFVSCKPLSTPTLQIRRTITVLSLYINFYKISEMSMYTPPDMFLEHPLLGGHGVTFTLDMQPNHADFNMIELFQSLRQHKVWESLDSEFVKNPLKVYTKLGQRLPNPWEYVPFIAQVWLNRQLVLGSVSEIVPSAVEKIIASCRRSSKFNRKAVNTMIIYRGHPANFSVDTYDITEPCYVLCGHSRYLRYYNNRST